jgi:hypothetical protein
MLAGGLALLGLFHPNGQQDVDVSVPGATRAMQSPDGPFSSRSAAPKPFSDMERQWLTGILVGFWFTQLCAWLCRNSCAP